ncbi:polysaccharide biosynthesis C-terminal domain-containing protein [Prevotella multiformis]|uniref:lipopolysaccharide biosynthesis protein n=1 Tax=Prevotella multiformis TaxID=282402 RepID=UPI0028DB54DA|nr:polysaccharide biosynthesis C-terminal domain-containing protein [Prevotella multiformis]
MGRNKKLAKNVIFILIGNVGSKLVGFFMLPLYTAWLSPEDYGLTDLLAVYASLLVNVVACDVSDAIYIYPVGASNEKIKTYYSSGFFFQVVCSLLCAFIFMLISRLPLHNTFIENIWYIYGILISSLFQKYTQDFCRGINSMSVFSFTGIIQTFATAGLSIALIPQFGVYGFVVATIVSNTTTALFTFFYSKSYDYLSLSYAEIESIKELLKFSIPLIPTAILWWLVSGLNRPLLEQYVGMLALGLMAVAFKLPTIMNLVFSFFQQAWIVTVVEEFKENDFANYFNRMYRIVMSVQIVACMIIVVIAHPFIRLMTNERYYDAWVYIPLLAFSVIFSNMSAFLGTVFSASRQTKFTFYSVVIGGLAALGLNYLLIPFWGIWGACFAIGLSQLLCVLSRFYYSRRLVKFTSLGFSLKQCLIFALIYISSLIFNHVMLVSAYIFCFLLYYWLNKDILLMAFNIVRNKITKK